MQLDVLRSKAKKADAAERARRTFEDQMRRMEQKLQAASDLKVQMAGMEQEREALTQEKAELQAKVGRTEQKLRKVTAERCARRNPSSSCTSCANAVAEAEQARLGARGCRRDQVETDLEMLRSSQASTHPSPHSSLLISASFLTVRATQCRARLRATR